MALALNEYHTLLMVSISSFLLVALLYIRLKRFYDEAKLKKDFIESLYLAIEYAGEKPIAKGLEIVMKNTKDERLKGILRREIISDLIKGTLLKRIKEAFKTESGEINYNKISSLIEKNEAELKFTVSEIESSMQRNATFNMFISTIAPSFIILGFIGNLIASGKFNPIMFFIMLIALPVLYAFGLTLSQRRLIDAFAN
ncbi:MAG: hypothetical protein RXR32_02560 [Candidatus Micrarchaeota archaeon]